MLAHAKRKTMRHCCYPCVGNCAVLCLCDDVVRRLRSFIEKMVAVWRYSVVLESKIESESNLLICGEKVLALIARQNVRLQTRELQLNIFRHIRCTEYRCERVYGETMVEIKLSEWIAAFAPHEIILHFQLQYRMMDSSDR